MIAATKRGSSVLEEFSYDPWGRRRHPSNWNNYTVTEPTLFTRGFTGHEHLEGFRLINMNGRMYDPRLGRFLSPDPYIQSPDYTQSFNRYSYVWNNPLKYTDPSGYSSVDQYGRQRYDAYGNFIPPYMRTGEKSYMNWFDVGFGGSPFGSIGLPGQGLNGSGIGGIYYDWYSGTIRSTLTLGELGWNDLISSGVTYIWNPHAGSELYRWSEGNTINIAFSGGWVANGRNYSLASSGRGNWLTNAFNVNTGLGSGSGILAGNYGLTAKQTFKYGVRQGGKVISASQRSAMHFSHSMKVVKTLGRVNVVTGSAGAIYSGYLAYSDYQEGGWSQVNSWDVSYALVGGGGAVVGGLVILGIVSNPVGWGVGIGVGLYFGGRLIYDLATTKH